MNTRRLQCAILLAKLRSFSQAAEELGISQPAFSKQIRSLEQDLGVALFDRESVPVSLTRAGEYFLRQAQELLYQEDRLIHTMSRFRSDEDGRLVIGISQFRSQYLMPPVVRALREDFPDLQVCLHEDASDRLRQDVMEGKFDFAIVNLPVDESVLDTIALEPDTLVLAVPNALLRTLPVMPEGRLSEIDLSVCRELPFIVAQRGQEMRDLFDRLCLRFRFHPPVVMEIFSLTTCRAMLRAGLGAALLPLQFLDPEGIDRDITLFTIKDNTNIRQPAIVYRRGQELSEPVRRAMKLLSTGGSTL